MTDSRKERVRLAEADRLIDDIVASGSQIDERVVLTVQQGSALLQISENHLYSLIA
jgi:hypothetical protein